MSVHPLGAELLDGLLPLGEPIVAGLFGLVTVLLGWIFGRGRNRQELDNLRAEKRSIESASSVSQAEAAQIISEAAAATVRPLLDRLKELREENAEQDEMILLLKKDLEFHKNRGARLEAENKLLQEQLKISGGNNDSVL